MVYCKPDDRAACYDCLANYCALMQIKLEILNYITANGASLAKCTENGRKVALFLNSYDRHYVRNSLSPDKNIQQCHIKYFK